MIGLSGGWLTDDANGASIVGLFVFIDKYTGPLGNAAVEAALLLSISATRGDDGATKQGPISAGVPAAVLLTLRLTTEAVCRPFFELLLAASSSTPSSSSLAAHWPVSRALASIYVHWLPPPLRPSYTLHWRQIERMCCVCVQVAWEVVAVSLVVGTTLFVLVALRRGDADAGKKKSD